MLLILSACWRVFGHISSLKSPFPIKTIQIPTSQIYLHKLLAADVKFLMLAQQQCLRHKKLLVTRDLIGEDMTLEMLEAFVKGLDIVAAGWDLEPCC